MKLEVQKIKLVCIHSQNNTYPVFTAKAKNFNFNFIMQADHDIYQIKLGCFKLLDNTRYPNTLSPLKNYNYKS